MKRLAMSVSVSIPPITTVPRMRRPTAPEPAAVHNGTQPRINANEVMKRARRRTRTPSSAASTSGMPCSYAALANSTMRSEERRVGKEWECGWVTQRSSRRRHTRFSRDWSSDVCSSDLHGTEDAASDRAGTGGGPQRHAAQDKRERGHEEGAPTHTDAFERGVDERHALLVRGLGELDDEIGRASCRERVGVWVGDAAFKQKTAYEIFT